MTDPTPHFQEVRKHFERVLEELGSTKPFARPRYINRLLASAESLLETKEGKDLVFSKMSELSEYGLFEDTPWSDPGKLVPALVGGTLKSGGLQMVMEILSDLRVSAIAAGRLTDDRCSAADARLFLQDALVQNLDLMFPGATEYNRSITESDRKKITVLFDHLKDQQHFDAFRDKLAEEIVMICAQRPILTERVRRIIHLVNDHISLREDGEEAGLLRLYVDAVYRPTQRAAEAGSVSDYAETLELLTRDELADEAQSLAAMMNRTGLCSSYHAVLLGKVRSDDELFKESLGLNETGRVQFDKHKDQIGKLIDIFAHPEISQSIYGFGRMLERGLLDRQPARSGLYRLMDCQISRQSEIEIMKSAHASSSMTAREVLLADVVSVLGLPLGIGQGMNPTCQGARGISLWSMNVPGKLLRMILKVVQENHLTINFEGSLIDSSNLVAGMAKKLDYNLDAVSVLLVPHLDKIYNEMMRLCSFRQEDAHKWVNPALYGQWVPTGFASAYDPVTQTISKYEEFVRMFYVTHHLDYNRGHDLVYPNPIGIFVTSNTGKLLGFHAITIIRVAKGKDGEPRVYFWNPNNEGRQHWGGGVTPSVADNGERHGESSLPFSQFSSRVYAYHYHKADLEDLSLVDDNEVQKVIAMARESWGPSYRWSEYSFN
ncbi:MAG TPA: hypothetical protein VKA08_01470 [Balneolales bacterium]|nr:hypothetical protein [Balneolales bacterium]